GCPPWCFSLKLQASAGLFVHLCRRGRFALQFLLWVFLQQLCQRRQAVFSALAVRCCTINGHKLILAGFLVEDKTCAVFLPPRSKTQITIDRHCDQSSGIVVAAFIRFLCQ